MLIEYVVLYWIHFYNGVRPLKGKQFIANIITKVIYGSVSSVASWVLIKTNSEKQWFSLIFRKKRILIDLDACRFTFIVCMSWAILYILVNILLSILNSWYKPFLPHSPLRAVGVLFSPMVSGWAGRQWEKVCPGCISETIRCRKLILSRDIG